MKECVCRLATECIRFIIETFAATLGNLVKLTENHMQIYETLQLFFFLLVLHMK